MSNNDRRSYGNIQETRKASSKPSKSDSDKRKKADEQAPAALNFY